jgi:NAD(P)H-dependent FMN reductase
MPTALTIAVIVASTRTARFADFPLAWVTERLGERPEFALDVIDLREHPLPFYDLQAPPAAAPRNYGTAEERALGERFDRADGFLVITNEYNHGYTAALKNTLDHYFIEFVRKPIGFVGYGNVGGSRAVEQLRLVAAELHMASVRHSVHIMGPQMGQVRADDASRAAVFATLEPRLDLLADDLAWWGAALRTARDADRPLG